MMTGLKASCDDLRRSADTLFDRQSLHDISVVSTLGLRESDVEALEALDSIERAEGEFSEKVQIELKGGYTKAQFKTFTPDGIDLPYIIEGRLPKKSGKAAVTRSYIIASEKNILTALRSLKKKAPRQGRSLMRQKRSLTIFRTACGMCATGTHSTAVRT